MSGLVSFVALISAGAVYPAAHTGVSDQRFELERRRFRI
jgi:hypothetical protein